MHKKLEGTQLGQLTPTDQSNIPYHMEYFYIFRLDIRKKFFTLKVVKHRPRLPREVVDAPFLETFMVSLDGALSNLI